MLGLDRGQQGLLMAPSCQHQASETGVTAVGATIT